jgi:hypothetical protein
MKTVKQAARVQVAQAKNQLRAMDRLKTDRNRVMLRCS